MSEPVLRVEGLRVAFDHPQGLVKAVDDVSFALSPGERHRFSFSVDVVSARPPGKR